MKFTTPVFFTFVTALGIISAVSSCTKSDRFAGTWQGNQERIANIPDAADASYTLTIDFAPEKPGAKNGVADFNAVVNISQAVQSTNPDALVSPFEANVTATASITATYFMENGEDDDILLSFDPSSLQVNVDPAGVTLTQDALSNTERPMLDSLTAATANHWRVLITSAMRNEFNRFTKIEDIKVHHGDMMSCEVDHRDLTFRRVGVPD